MKGDEFGDCNSCWPSHSQNPSSGRSLRQFDFKSNGQFRGPIWRYDEVYLGRGCVGLTASVADSR
jgi:hypothetical protein